MAFLSYLFLVSAECPSVLNFLSGPKKVPSSADSTLHYGLHRAVISSHQDIVLQRTGADSDSTTIRLSSDFTKRELRIFNGPTKDILTNERFNLKPIQILKLDELVPDPLSGAFRVNNADGHILFLIQSISYTTERIEIITGNGFMSVLINR